ncbi:choline-sulfatase [Jiella sp. MQZ9-1]|uniref:Choline-sulfatase n=1 Tax=Jiella flava TaxID=2816857 RepID=A0A939JYB3_9HYPH|nr:choline-sulfatase [Jiella flava]MBO0664236.1 choline-sulfatase [Jiella flava]MCD2472882.1 choline-sulfatase [Jiella flava]
MARPNFLIIMVDQANGTLFPDGPADFLRLPHLKALAARSVRFKNSYTASPLCAPGRAAFMSGQLPSRTRVYDNAAEFASAIPTFAHHLRRAGYSTCLSGKMHFVGPDQLHGFEQRLTTDVYPADFGWTPDYRKPGERIDWWYHNLGSVTGAGIAEITNQMEYDDEVAFHAEQKLYDLSRGHDARPFALTVSFTHPHDPYVARRRFWDLFEDCEHLEPRVGTIPFDEQDAHSQRLYLANDYKSFDITPDNVRRARRGYFANLAYLDAKIGSILDVLNRTRMADNTVVVFVSDHGDMLGERGLWFKMSFFDGSARVPLMIAAPGIAPCRVDDPVSTIDMAPTLADLAGIDMGDIMPWTDGHSLVPMIEGAARSEPVYMEYAAEGSYAPLVSIREGRWKFNHCELDPPQLFDLDADPDERTNLATDPAHAETLAGFQAKMRAKWDMARFDVEVRESQARRWVVYEALRNGAYYPWDYQPLQKASERYMRNHMDLNVVEENQRFPRGD